jgi:cytochrome P450
MLLSLSEGIPLANPKYLMPFSRGMRHCLRQPLVYAEIYMTLATVLRTFAKIERGKMGRRWG